MPKLTIYAPDEEPLKVAFEDQQEVTVGRAADNDIVLTHDSISGNHAKLQLVDDGSYILVDLGSTNGTFFNGAPANNDTLYTGAEIAFGQVPAAYEGGEDQEEPAAAEAPAAGGFSDTSVESGESLSHSIHAEAASQSVRPGDYKNLSPLGKIEKKDVVGQSIMLVAVLGILAAVATIATAVIMSVD